MAALVYAFIVVVDPFDHLSLSPDLPRAPIAENQRYTYPGLARKARFDSAVVGTSTSRLLRPACLDEQLDARFVSLAMNSAEAWEQVQILDVFLRAHPSPRTIVMGLDGRWLDAREPGRPPPPKTSPHYRFPPWLYDEDPHNDYLHLFDRWTFERARRQLSYLLGFREAKYGPDGYRDFLPDFGDYDLSRAREKLYGPIDVETLAAVHPPVVLSPEEQASLEFPTHELFVRLLATLPAETEKIFFFPPYHVTRLGPPGGRPDAVREVSKARLARWIAEVPRARLLDFQIRSDLTREDANFWDPVHVTEPVAQAMCEAFRTSRDGTGAPGLYDLRVP